jgi:diacylglycerol kinase family enzyme
MLTASMRFSLRPQPSLQNTYKTAVLLNANARAVDEKLKENFLQYIPQDDLFFSQNLQEAEHFANIIAQRGYQRVFMGGGDGTIMHALHLIEQACQREHTKMPQFGILKLGTGNALARYLKAARPVRDVQKIKEDRPVDITHVNFITTENGLSAPFVSLGYDGQIVNDYETMKSRLRHPLLKKVFSTLFGYLFTIFFNSLPKIIFREKCNVTIISNTPGIMIHHQHGIDEWVEFEAGTVLYEGSAGLITAGTIPFYGFGFRMFPYIQTETAFFQLRVVNIPLWKILLNVWPKVWRGTFRDQQLHDYLVQDVDIITDRLMDYQIGGDAHGQRTRVRWRLAEQQVEMMHFQASDVYAQHK